MPATKKGEIIMKKSLTALLKLSKLTKLPRKSYQLAGEIIYGGKYTVSCAREELVAEIGSMFISCAAKSEEVFQASYIDSWLECIRNDSNAIFKATADASRATDFIKYKQGV